MRFLFVGDIVGKPGREIVRSAIPGLVAQQKIDLVIANAENAAGGSGLTPAIYRELMQVPVHAITLGDHVYRRKEITTILESQSNIVRPANLPLEATGRQWATITAANGETMAICCLLGQLFMQPVDCPFRAADRVLAEIPSDVRVRLVDFHAEATSEAQMMGRYLDGRVSAVLGTHTHVPTADECLLPGGTAFQCDVGMTGPFESIIGRRIDRVLQTRLTAYPTPFDVAAKDPRLCGTLVEVDSQTGLATSIERICIDSTQAAQLQRSQQPLPPHDAAGS
jgi:metallophosphoesterase (TIGR00282 family)